MSHKYKFLNQELTFHPLLPYVLSFGNADHTQQMTMTILKSSFPLHGIDASNNQFHIGIDSMKFYGIEFHGIDAWVLKKFKNSGSAYAKSNCILLIFSETCIILVFQNILIIFGTNSSVCIIMQIKMYKCLYLSFSSLNSYLFNLEKSWGRNLVPNKQRT
jgi:hypothetical protein